MELCSLIHCSSCSAAGARRAFAIFEQYVIMYVGLGRNPYPVAGFEM